MDMKRASNIFICIIFSAFLLCGCKSGAQQGQTPEANEKQPAQPEVSTVAEEGKARSYLSGYYVDEEIVKRRPVAIMLSNIKAAQPMSGITYADVVFEYVVEGGITRAMGIFENYDNLEKIGSVRSCREYFVYGALEFDAIYLHFGQASYAVPLLEQDYVDNINGLGKGGNVAYYRTTDRNSPHNVYTSAEGIEAGIKMLGYRREHNDDYMGKFTFTESPEEEVTYSDGEKVNRVEPGYPVNKPWFEYNEEDKLYYRYQYGEPHIDDLTGQQVAYKNIILQYSAWQQLDEADYLGFDCHVGGDIQYISNGYVKEGTWRRLPGPTNYDDGPVKYYDENGDELVVNCGKTWICALQNTRKDKVVIE